MMEIQDQIQMKEVTKIQMLQATMIKKERKRKKVLKVKRKLKSEIIT